jgi:hypothetical protein
MVATVTGGKGGRALAATAGALVLVLSLGPGASPAGAAPAVAIGSARFGNTFVVGEPAELTVRVTADADRPLRGALRVAVRDAYGGSAGRMRLRVELPAGGTMAWPVPITSRRLGYFTAQAALFGRKRRPIATAGATAGIVPPVDDSDPDASGVGYYVIPFPSELPDADAIAAQARQFGIRWVRISFNWLDDARRTAPNVRDPSWLATDQLERWVDAYRRHGIEVLVALFGTARWASSQPDNVTVDNDRIRYPVWGLVTPGDLADWQRLVRTLAERLQGRVRHWELWNEPDSIFFWRSSASEFAALLQATASALRGVDPASRLVLNFVNLDDAAAAFQEEVLAAAGHELDGIGWHYGSLETIAAARALTPRLRPGASLWNTEAYGVPRRLISRWLQQRAAGVERLFSFVYHMPISDAELGLLRFGLYPVNVDYTPRPDAIALRTLSDVVGSAVPIASAAVGRGYLAHEFATPEGAVTALVDGNDPGLTWMPDAPARLQLALPPQVRRVEVIDLMGNRQLRTVRRRRLRLRMLGVASFLRAEGAASLSGLRVVRSHRAR